MVIHAINSSTWEADIGGVRGPAWSTEWVQNSQDYTEKLCLEKNKTKPKQTNKTDKKLGLAFLDR